MAWFNDGFAVESDLLSVALGESGLNLSEHEALTTFDRSEAGSSTGGSLSLESTSTPSELLNWALYLRNPNNQTLSNTQDDYSRLLEPFSDLQSVSNHNKDIKTSFSSRNEQTSFSDLYSGTNGLYPPSGINEGLSNKTSESLFDLLSADEVNSGASALKSSTLPTTNGTGNKTEPQLQKK